MMKLLLCLLLATVQLLPPIVESGRSEGEARSQCIAACLKDFKARVSPQLKWQTGPASRTSSIASAAAAEEAAARGRENPDTDAEAVANCSSCTRACNWFDTKSFPRNSTSCGAFCQLKSDSVNRAFLRCSVRTGFLPIELSPTGQQWGKCRALLRPSAGAAKVFGSRGKPPPPPAARSRATESPSFSSPTPATVRTPAHASCRWQRADAIACRARGSPCARQGDDRDCQGGLRPLRCCQSECGFSVCSPANISLE
uniref:ShKT domain-containing protein n=1 Tax=Macrostomum lignano TaxID=282301 RepID=A0A1I8FJF0_9PLAT